jgi:hypothetical protein
MHSLHRDAMRGRYRGNEAIAGKIGRVRLPASERGPAAFRFPNHCLRVLHMHSLDSTIVARIAETFHTTLVRLSIAITAYIEGQAKAQAAGKYQGRAENVERNTMSAGGWSAA